MENNFLASEYRSRINRAFDYIEANIDRPFSLEEISRVACFSKFHFSRIFQAMVGESPFRFILRIRLERAASLLQMNRKESITDIAFKCGFTDLSVFSRNFTGQFGQSASQYRRTMREKSNLSQTGSNSEQVKTKASMYFCSHTQTIKWWTQMKLNKSVEVKSMPAMTLAYVRHIGPYQGNDKLFEGLWNKLFSWAGPRGLIGGPDFRSLVIYHDDPNITSGYQPDDKPCYEMYPEEPKNGKFVVDICVPVRPM